jgi:DNA-binding MarR family transcriptional regulator
MASPVRDPCDTAAEPDFNHPGSIFDLVNFRMSELMNVSGSLVTRMCEGEFGVTRQEWQFVAMLATMGPTSPSDLAARTTIDRSQGSKTLRALSDKKLVRRESVHYDRRRTLVHLKERGQGLFEAVFPRAAEINRAVLSGLSAAERSLLASLVHRLHLRALEVDASGIVGGQANRRRGGSRAIWSD